MPEGVPLFKLSTRQQVGQAGHDRDRHKKATFFRHDEISSLCMGAIAMGLELWMHGTAMTVEGSYTGFIQEIAGDFILIFGDGDIGEFWVCKDDFTPDLHQPNELEREVLKLHMI